MEARTVEYAVCGPEGLVILRGTAKAMRRERKKLGKGYYTTQTGRQVGEMHGERAKQ